MSRLRRRFKNDAWIVLLMPACGVAALLGALVLVFSVPVIILSAPPIPSPVLPSSIPSVAPSFTPAPLTPSVTPGTPPPSRTPTRPVLGAIESLSIYNRTHNVWVTNSTGDSVAEVDARDPGFVHTVLSNIPSPHGIVIWQARGVAYVSNPSRNTVTEINLATNRPSAAFIVGAAPTRLTVDQLSGDV